MIKNLKIMISANRFKGDYNDTIIYECTKPKHIHKLINFFGVEKSYDDIGYFDDNIPLLDDKGDIIIDEQTLRHLKTVELLLNDVEGNYNATYSLIVLLKY